MHREKWGGGGTTICKLYRYVQQERLWFWGYLSINRVCSLPIFGTVNDPGVVLKKVFFSFVLAKIAARKGPGLGL